MGRLGKGLLTLAPVALVSLLALFLTTGDSDSTLAPEPPRAVGGCSVDAATMTAAGCTIEREDTAAVADPKAGLWGNIECAADSRHQQVGSGGDPHPRSDGSAQEDDAYRRLTVIDGDDYYGERCELGRNDHLDGENSRRQTSGTFALYGAGQRRITFFSERYGGAFAPGVDAWQTVMQMKQAEPADSAGYGPVLELQIYRNRLRLFDSWTERWTTAAPPTQTWIRYAVDVVYSNDPGVGAVQVYVDLNGDGDAVDRGERSPRMNMATLVTETSGPSGLNDGLAPGDQVPSHLRLGLYHDTPIPCPPSDGCVVDVDNVQVVSG